MTRGLPGDSESGENPIMSIKTVALIAGESSYPYLLSAYGKIAMPDKMTDYTEIGGYHTSFLRG